MPTPTAHAGNFTHRDAIGRGGKYIRAQRSRTFVICRVTPA
ncbi:MAG: hypothetical protein ABSG02_18615 [Terriglobales bacterium]|jgi:hypothetical protein